MVTVIGYRTICTFPKPKETKAYWNRTPQVVSSSRSVPKWALIFSKEEFKKWKFLATRSGTLLRRRFSKQPKGGMHRGNIINFGGHTIKNYAWVLGTITNNKS
jgi:hypothetical protein